jgi:hypothetical protein
MSLAGTRRHRTENMHGWKVARDANDFIEIGWSRGGITLSFLAPDTATLVRSIYRSMNLI